MTYNSTVDKNWKKASIYEIFLSAERNCHFSQVRFTPNLLMPIFILQITTAWTQITPRFHQHSSCWQNQLKQLLPPQQRCFIAGGAAPSASSTDVAQHQASKQLHHHFWRSCMAASRGSGNWQKKFRLAFLAHATAAVHQHLGAQASMNVMITWTT